MQAQEQLLREASVHVAQVKAIPQSLRSGSSVSHLCPSVAPPLLPTVDHTPSALSPSTFQLATSAAHLYFLESNVPVPDKP